MKRALLLIAITSIGAPSCSDEEAFGPEASTRYRVAINPASASRGSTIKIGVSFGLDPHVRDAEFTRLLVRADCAVNVIVIHESQIVTTFPESASCPDSLEILEITRDIGLILREYEWDIPHELEPGTYVFRGETVVQPRMSAEGSIPIM